MATLYETLGVREDATEDEIKRAYRKAVMHWHPDRNVGQEDLARVRFHEIKDAYAILSDPAQRQVYDAVFAEEMRRWESHRQRVERERAEREVAAQAAAEAEYAEMVALAMRFTAQGYNRDVVFGVLLGREYDVQLATRIADSVWALHESRRADATTGPEAAAPEEPTRHQGAAQGEAASHGRAHAGLYDRLWHSWFGIRA
jgi:curved DNA-binding protein CbpA